MVDDFNQPDIVRHRVVVRDRVDGYVDLQSIFGHSLPARIAEKQQAMIDRIFRNPKTTIIGLTMVVVSFVFVWFGKATLSELSAFFIGGFSLFFFKDGDKN